MIRTALKAQEANEEDFPLPAIAAAARSPSHPALRSSEAGRWTAQLQRPPQPTSLRLAFHRHLRNEAREPVVTVVKTNAELTDGNARPSAV